METKIHLAAGAASGFISCIALQPLDLLKTGNLGVSAAFRDVINESGVFGFWRGTVATIWRNVPGSGIYFYVLNLIRSSKTLKPLNRDLVNLGSGISARIIVGFMMMPVTVIKTRFESNLYNYSSMLHATKSIVKNDGIKGLFTGFGATALRDAPFAGVYVYFYENIKSLSPFYNQMATNMTSGICAGFAATLITQPFDTLKTRIQLDPRQYVNLISGTRYILVTEGISGFFVGMIPRLLRKSLSSAISWTIYEEVLSVYKSI